MTKKYLGKTADLTLAQLEHIAGMVHAQSQTHIPPPVSPATARTDGEMDSIQRPDFRGLRLGRPVEDQRINFNQL